MAEASTRRGLLLIACATAALMACGCSDGGPVTPTASDSTATPRAAVALTVLVFGDEDLAAGVTLLRGEWAARSGGTLEVTSGSIELLNAAEPLRADVVVFPSRYLGALAERGQLRTVRASLLANREFNLNDIYPAIRNGELIYGGQTLALPLGSPPLLACYRRADGEGERPDEDLSPLPTTWVEYRRFIGVESSATAEGGPNGAALAMSGDAAAFTLIGRAVAYTDSQRRRELLFDPETMAPRIADPAFVRALSEIVEEVRAAGGEQALDFAAAITKVGAGGAGAAFGWPGLVEHAPGESQPPPAAFAPLPTATATYSANRGLWENQSFAEPVTLLGVEGRLLGVCESSRNATSAFKLCQWLSTGDVAIELSSRSRGTMWFRKSQHSRHAKWTGRNVDAPGDEVTAAVEEALERESPIMTPRIPGIDDYLAALAEETRRAVAGNLAPAAALQGAASRWEAITDQRGRQQQATAYRRHLGSEDLTQR